MNDIKTIQRIIPILQTISLVASLVLITVSFFLMFVSGVAIIFLYISLLLALLAYNHRNITLLKIYAFFFIIAHIPFLIMMLNSSNKHPVNNSSEFPNFSLFEECSNEMFSNKQDLKKPMTEIDRKTFTVCMNSKEQ